VSVNTRNERDAFQAWQWTREELFRRVREDGLHPQEVARALGMTDIDVNAAVNSDQEIAKLWIEAGEFKPKKERIKPMDGFEFKGHLRSMFLQDGLLQKKAHELLGVLDVVGNPKHQDLLVNLIGKLADLCPKETASKVQTQDVPFGQPPASIEETQSQRIAMDDAIAQKIALQRQAERTMRGYSVGAIQVIPPAGPPNGA
jgi:hypothetical protein